MLKILERRRALEQKYREEHRCVKCGTKCTQKGRASAISTIRCSACLEKDRIQKKELRQKRQAAGLCILCGKKVEAGYKICNRNECIPSRRLRQ